MTKSYLRPKRLREASMRDADVALQELHHRERERELVGPLFHLGPCQGVLDHELRQVSHDLRRRSHLEKEMRVMEVRLNLTNTAASAIHS